MGEETRKGQREGTSATAENLRKVPCLDQEKILGVEDNGIANVEFSFVKGMPNLGNTCYFNAVVQCLLALGKLRTKILRPDAKLGVMGKVLKDLFMKTSIPGYAGELMDPAILIACVRAVDSSFKGQGMHDSQKLFLAFIRRLGEEEEEEEEQSKPPHTQEGISRAAMPDCIFGGMMCVKSSCSCSRFTVKSVPFTNLELALPMEGSGARNTASTLPVCADHPGVDQFWSKHLHSLTSIEDCLKRYFEAKKLDWCCSSMSRSTDSDQTSTKVAIPSNGHQIEQLDRKPSQDNQNDSTGRVEELKVIDGAVQRSSISKLPDVMTLLVARCGVHLGGRNADPSTIKLSGHITFEEILDVRKCMDPSYEVENSTYHLAGVVEHIGESLKEGHYVSYVKAKANAEDQICRWFCVDDMCVKQVSLEEVRKCEAYILFYERGED